MTCRKARRICGGLVENKYPGFALMMDRIDPYTYMSLWGCGERRIEIVFPRKNKGEIKAHIAEYRVR